MPLRFSHVALLLLTVIGIRLEITTPYPAWCSRNEKVLARLSTALCINMDHLPRSYWCKAAHIMTKFNVKCSEDSATVLGVLLIIVCLASQQNAKVDIQVSSMKLLRGILSIIPPGSIPLIRDEAWSHLQVLAEGVVSLDSFQLLLQNSGLKSRREAYVIVVLSQVKMMTMETRNAYRSLFARIR
jgi:hypothetical protein